MAPLPVTPPLAQESQREHPVFALYRDAVHEVATTDGVPLVPASEDLAAREKSGQTVFMDPIHPNPSGHEIIAALAAQTIIPLLRQRIASSAGGAAAAPAR